MKLINRMVDTLGRTWASIICILVLAAFVAGLILRPGYTLLALFIIFAFG